MKVKCSIFFLLLFSFNQVFSQEESDFSYKLKGLVFGDAYYVDTHHLPEANDIAGAVMRRAYITFDTKFAKNWYTRLRFEANQSGEYQTYNFEVEVKDLLIGYKFEKHKIVFGLSPTKTFDIIEGIWGLRYLARTPMDMQGSASREWGLAVDGNIISKIGLKYRTMISHDIDFGGETGEGFRVQGAISWQPDNVWTVDFFTDYERVEGESNGMTYQIFIAYEREKIRWGTHYSNNTRQDDSGLELFSAFVVGSFYKNISAIARVDRIMKPSPRGNNISYIPFDPNSKATFLIGGFEFPLGKYLTLTPNIIHIIYDENDIGVKPQSDLTYRLTAYFKI
ncbi:MAG: hypothetical protein KAH10_07805 [Flavobacteriales bacterium]|nr:hypothetical protein [Flavobacteriales bacterium]